MLEKYRSVALTLDMANQYVPNTLVTSGLDARGRTFDLTITDNGEEVDLTDAIVWLVWHHNTVGNSGVRKFEPVEPEKGKFTCNFPVNMAHLGFATASIVVTDAGPSFYLPSLEFRITIQSAILDGQEADTCDDFSDLQEAMGNLHTVIEETMTQLTDQQGIFEALMTAFEGWYREAENQRNTDYQSAEDNRDSQYATAEQTRRDDFDKAEVARGEQFDEWEGKVNASVNRADAAAQKVDEVINGNLDPMLKQWISDQQPWPIESGGTGASTAEEALSNLFGGSQLPIESGGTGQSTIEAARNAFGLGNTAGALPVANGGTGATSASQARINLGINVVSKSAAGLCPALPSSPTV